MKECKKDTKILGELIHTQKGYAFKSKWYTEEGHPIIKVSDFTDCSIRSDNLVYIPKNIASEYLKYEVKPKDVIIQTVGSWPNNPNSVVGKTVHVPFNLSGALLNQNSVKVIPKDSLDNGFLFYLLRSSFFKDYIINTAQGAANQASITLDSIKRFTFWLPDLSTQCKLSTILSNYDDLIENNTRRIEILEQMAKLVYEEWFVKFRFPGHENVKMVPSDLGEIPEGWKVKKLEKIANVNELSIKNGGAPQEINYIDISSVTTGKVDEIKSIAFTDAPSRARRIVKHGDIIWSTVRPNRKSFAMILNPLPNLIVSTGFAVITAKKIPYTYLYHALTTDDFVGYLTNNATGAAYPAVNTNDFNNANILVPPEDYLHQFHNIVSNVFSLKQNLLDKNQNLRKTRDLLLPKLISGEIDVSDLDIRIRNEFQES